MSHFSRSPTTSSGHWLMALLCFLPLAGLVALYFFNIPISSVLLAALVLACPIIHLIIMRQGDMIRHGDHLVSTSKGNESE